MVNREEVCCFTGHRHIGGDELHDLGERLTNEMEELICRGVIFFGCGGAIGFDTLAGFVTLKLREKYPNIKLIMVLPCRNQDINWPAEDRANYQTLLASADKIVYVSERYYDGCMQERNAHLVKNSGYCVAYLKHDRSGTSQTVRMANEQGLVVINLANGKS